jgi:cytochrome c oxidase subunit 2
MPTCPESHTAAPTPRSRSRRLVVAAAVLAPLLLAGCETPSFGAFRGSTTQGQDTFKLWQLFFIAGLIIGGMVFLLILFTILRYHRRKRTAEGMPKQTQYHTVVEILYTIVPILIVLFLFVFTVITENRVTAVSPSPDVRVKVVAFQWGWEFDYPGHSLRVNGAANIVNGHIVGATKINGRLVHEVPTMVIPAGKTVQIHLVSRDVIHGFYVPQFNFSRYAQPGFDAQYFDLNVVKPGMYRGQCTQLCGLYHSVMLFNVKAVTPAQFQTWIHSGGRVT